MGLSLRAWEGHMVTVVLPPLTRSLGLVARVDAFPLSVHLFPFSLPLPQQVST